MAILLRGMAELLSEKPSEAECLPCYSRAVFTAGQTVEESFIGYFTDRFLNIEINISMVENCATCFLIIHEYIPF
jgi:hypothetical protein